MGLVRGQRLRVRQLPVARHAQILRTGRSGPVCAGSRHSVRTTIRYPVDTGYISFGVLHSGYVHNTYIYVCKRLLG